MALAGWVAVGAGCIGDPPAAPQLSGTDGSSGDGGSGSELALDCLDLPLAAEGASFAFTPTAGGLREGVAYRYWSPALPAGLVLDEISGQLNGLLEAQPGQHVFELMLTEVDDPEVGATAVCDLEVRPRLSASLDIDAVPHCLRMGDRLLDHVVDGTGDGTPITCDYSGGNGNGRLPDGIEVDPETCTLTGAINEDRYGTWVFIMRATQSGISVFVPYCVTNDEPQGYEITADHSGGTNVALEPITRRYDPTADFAVGEDGDPRYEMLGPGICGASCFFKYSFLRTNAPLGDGGFDLQPDGLVQDPDTMQSVGFFHELRLSGPPVPEEFRDRPWVLSVAVSYCMAADDTSCEDPAADGEGALEFGVIMVPEPG